MMLLKNNLLLKKNIMKKIITKILLWLLIFSQIWNITTYADNSC